MVSFAALSVSVCVSVCLDSLSVSLFLVLRGWGGKMAEGAWKQMVRGCGAACVRGGGGVAETAVCVCVCVCV